MPWSSLGNIKPEYQDWTFWPETDVNGDLFRLTHHYELGGVTGRLLVGAYYPAYDAWSEIQLIYPDPPKQILLAPVPQVLIDQGVVVRDFAAKITFGSNVLEQDNWRLDLDVWL